jgi:hypothetical protein
MHGYHIMQEPTLIISRAESYCRLLQNFVTTVSLYDAITEEIHSPNYLAVRTSNLSQECLMVFYKSDKAL